MLFFTAIEERDNPHFAGKPIVVGVDPKAGRGRGVVSTANYEARKYGIHSAIPIAQAYRLCPKAVFLPVNIEKYQQVSQNIFTILQKYSSLIEKVSIDEAYLGLDEKKLSKDFKKDDPYEAAKVLAKKIKDEIFEKEKLTCSCGIGPNKLIAKIASDHQKPNGLTIVRPNEVVDFLKEKPVSAISGIGPKTEKVLAEAEKENFSFSTLEVTIRYFDFDTKSSQMKVNGSTFEDLKNHLLKLLLKFLGKKKIRLVGVRVGK
jgi:Nucleotidyltransferase/DNA polymerase involved in DNA repair